MQTVDHKDNEVKTRAVTLGACRRDRREKNGAEIGSTGFIRYLALEGKGDCPPSSGEWWYELGQLMCPFWNAQNHRILGVSRSFRAFHKAVHNLGAKIRKEARFGDTDLVVVATMIMCLTNLPLLEKCGLRPLHFKRTSVFKPRPCISQVASSH